MLKYHLWVGRDFNQNWRWGIETGAPNHALKNQFVLLIGFTIVIPNVYLRKASFSFFEQLNLLQKMGFSLLKSLELMMASPRPCFPIHILKNIHQNITQGMSLKECFQEHAAFFSPLSLAFLNIAHESGQFFESMALWFDHEKCLIQAKKNIQQQLSYPMTLIFLLMFIMLFFYQQMLPQYLHIFQQMNKSVPTSLQRWMDLKNLFLTLSFGFLFLLFSYRFWIKYLPFKKTMDWWIWSATMKICMQAGLSWLDSFYLMGEHFPHLHQKKWLEHTKKKIRLGERLHLCFENTPIILQQYLPMLNKTQDAHLIFEKLTEYFHQELATNIKRIERYLQPFLLMIIAVMAGFMIWMMYQPIFELGEYIL